MSDALTKLKQAHQILGETIAEMEGNIAPRGLLCHAGRIHNCPNKGELPADQIRLPAALDCEEKPKEAQPIIPPWLRELEARWMPPSALVTPEEFALATQKVKDLEALAELRAAILRPGVHGIDIPDSVAKHLSVAGSEEPSPSGIYHRKESWPEYWVYQGESERWPGGVTETTTRFLTAIDAAGAEIIK